MPQPGATQVRIRVEAVGICGTDIDEVRSGPVTVPVTPHAVSGRSAPITLGHEVVGFVDAAGDEAGIPVGARVAPWPLIPCGRCRECATGHENRCPAMVALGMSADGGMAESMLVGSSRCVVIHPETKAERAVLVEPYAVALHAAHQVPLRDRRVAVVGIGSVGLCMVEVARHAGAAEVIAISRSDAGRAAAASGGASTTTTPDAAREIEADIVIEAAGSAAAMGAALGSARRGGHVIVLGAHHGAIGLDLLDATVRELVVHGAVSHCFERDFVAAADLIDAGALATFRRRVIIGELNDGPRLLREASSGAKRILVVGSSSA